MMVVPGFAKVEKPKVMGATFKSSRTELLKYLDQFSGKAREREHLRLAQLIYIKEDLAKLLSHMPYNPPKGGRVLVQQSGKLTLMPCLFVKGNENQIDFKTARGQYIKLSWADIPSETIMVMMEYYLQLKIANVKIQQNDRDKRSEMKLDLADFSMRMALFADWNGLKTKSQQYSKIATKCQPGYKKHVDSFLSH